MQQRMLGTSRVHPDYPKMQNISLATIVNTTANLVTSSSKKNYIKYKYPADLKNAVSAPRPSLTPHECNIGFYKTCSGGIVSCSPCNSTTPAFTEYSTNGAPEFTNMCAFSCSAGYLFDEANLTSGCSPCKKKRNTHFVKLLPFVFPDRYVTCPYHCD